MGSALPADTEASDTPASVYREQFPKSSLFGCDGDSKSRNQGWVVDCRPGHSLSTELEPLWRSACIVNHSEITLDLNSYSRYRSAQDTEFSETSPF